MFLDGQILFNYHDKILHFTASKLYPNLLFYINWCIEISTTAKKKFLNLI